MNSKLIGKFAIGLWIVTVITLGYFFYFGSTSRSLDNRTAIHLTPAERQLVLTEMRALLTAVNGMLSGLADKDYEGAAKAADAVGMGLVASLEHQEKTILLKLPVEFKKLGFGTHEKFDSIAAKIRNKQEIHSLLKEMDELTRNCVACHASYKIEVDSDQK
ncbi:hypothetical protein EHQ23_14720 [Leptospira bourretii]|uniref:Cytochrome C n=1 Tax=Leptospira bourretii TaxID=2484962 RepID=A0A4R9IRW0_9LEPT|nr:MULTISPECIES: hypothetical protein [Leptospira]MCG6139137.1 hypothetical protein [Leptospira mtsangambouensis]TGK85868.1 hypothetical protein EHQ23_14720 [Leptospira bourretii]TGK94766.1 hypothetical protein EHQ26_02150 [Leptospira bourretii]TGL25119.1 hypothetical protein EHQ47_04080 [Leptospira bourretii]TGL33679.1 hypothetical protein EHQ45_09745 [Leptospira bourretii]